MKDILIPILTLLIALISIFAKTENIKSIKDIIDNRLLSSLIVLLVLSTFTNAYISSYDSIKKNIQLESSDKQIHNLTKILINFKTETVDNFENIKNQLKVYGLKVDNKLTFKSVEKIFNANRAREKIIDKVGQDIGKHIEVIYYPKDVDGEAVIKALQDLHFKVKKGQAVNKIETNSIWYGANVTQEQVSAVALTLIRAGVNLKQIKQIPFRNNYKDLRIQVGAEPNSLIRNRKTITVEEITSKLK